MFQSAPLLRGATVFPGDVEAGFTVSIRAPLARGDRKANRGNPTRMRFNPRPSCEGRPAEDWIRPSLPTFQSAPLLRGATVVDGARGEDAVFQSAPLLRGATGFPPLVIA